MACLGALFQAQSGILRLQAYQWVSRPRWQLEGPARGMQSSTMPKWSSTDTISVAQQGCSSLCLDLRTHNPLSRTPDCLAAASCGQVSVSCLNSVAPSPLNWKMWCPDTHATVTHWVDSVGSTHRKIELQAMPEMTANMAVWFMSPMFPKTLTIDDKVGT